MHAFDTCRSMAQRSFVENNSNGSTHLNQASEHEENALSYGHTYISTDVLNDGNWIADTVNQKRVSQIVD